MLLRAVRRSHRILAAMALAAVFAGAIYLAATARGGKPATERPSHAVVRADSRRFAESSSSYTEPPGYAVVYARSRWIGETYSSYVDIWWQRLPEETPRLVCTVEGYGEPTYVPSPDGRWLYVEHEVREEGGAPTASRFFIISLPHGEVVPLAEVRSVPRGGYGGFRLTFAPYWLDNSRLLLESKIGRAVFDLEQGKFTQALPEWPPKTLPESAYGYTSLPKPEEFVREHYADGLQCAQEAMAIFGAEMGLDDYLSPGGYSEPDTLETMLARPLGIFTLSVPRAGKRTWPSLACSPNHRYVARAAILPTDRAVKWKDSDGNWHSGRLTAIQLDFFDLLERERHRFVSDRWPGYARDGKPFRASVLREFMAPRLTDLRFSPDGRFFSYTVEDILSPPGLPNWRGGTSVVKVQGRVQHGFPHTGVYIYDTEWMIRDPCEDEDSDDPYEYLYFIPDAYNAFVVPATEEQDAPQG